jgi:hypothetical protein
MDEIYPALWKVHLTKAYERRIMLDFHIPKSVKLHFDEEKQGTMVHTDGHKVCLYETMF